MCFFHATSADRIRAAFAAIGERQTVDVPLRTVERTRELFIWFVAPAIVFTFGRVGAFESSKTESGIGYRLVEE